MNNKRIKIISTIGPSSWDYQTLKRLAQAGMDIVRLNFSHGTHKEKLEQIQSVRKISKELDKPIAIIADLAGPKMRLGSFEGKREIKKGEKIQLSINPIEDELPIQFDLSPYVKINQRIFLNDGLVELKVVDKAEKTIKTIAQNSGWVSSNKGLNVPDTHIKGGAFSQKDYKDALFAIKEKVDYLAISFVQTADDLNPVRKLLQKECSKTNIIAKIETFSATLHLEEIIKFSDAVMVARGDLAIETKAEEVPVLQQKIVRLARQYQKPVIIATQMLESMVENPRPTRAEASDVANAVLYQADVVMLSAETASGKYPVEAVKVMQDIIVSVEKHPDYYTHINVSWDNILSENVPFSAIAESAAILADRIKAKAIIVSTATGRMARLLASFRPNSQIIAVTTDEQVKNQLALVWGINPIIVKPAKDFNHALQTVSEEVLKRKFVKKGDKVVIINGTKVGKTGSTDTIKLMTI